MPALFDTFPYPWHLRDAQELHATLTQIYPTGKGALFVASKVGLDPAILFGDQAPYLVWKDVLDAAASAGLTRALVQLVRDQNSGNPRRLFLEALLEEQPVIVDSEPRGVDSTPIFLEKNDDISEPEALLFHDDLTLPIGRVPKLIETLQRLLGLAPSICRLEVDSAIGKQRGTGFRIGTDLLLTNWHVLFPLGKSPTAITAELGYEDDGKGGGLASMALPCDVASVHADKSDDWGVVRVAQPLPDTTPVIKLSEAAQPVLQSAAFIIQHPGGDRKRLAYVRNQITAFDNRVIHYLSDTQVGSSGSPVLNEEGRLVALHHAGGRPQEVAGKLPLKKNEGIRIERIVAGLQKAGISAP